MFRPFVRHPRLASGGLLLLALCMGGCKKEQKVNAAAPSSADPAEVQVTPGIAGNLRIGSPQMLEVEGKLEVTARIDTDARRIARVGSPVEGRILRLIGFEGENVRAGSVLATLHSTDLSEAQLSLVKAHSQQILAEAGEKRAVRLVEADVIGRAELERRRAELLQASAETSSYRTQLRGLGMSEAQIAQVESTNKLSAEYPIVAPRSGTLLERKITIGQVVRPADPAFTIADLSSVWVTANVPEEDAGQLQQGLEVTVRVPAFPDKQIRGRLSYVAPIVDPSTRTVQVRMDLPNPEGIYKPDQLASMGLTGHPQHRLTVPATAVVREENKDFLFFQLAPNKFIMREVSLGAEVDDHRIVLGGANEHDRIVTDGAFHLNNQRKQSAIKGGQ
jgi:cobalt-zinc-cadmium efflux system membrane fusion protein